MKALTKEMAAEAGIKHTMVNTTKVLDMENSQRNSDLNMYAKRNRKTNMTMVDAPKGLLDKKFKKRPSVDIQKFIEK